MKGIGDWECEMLQNVATKCILYANVIEALSHSEIPFHYHFIRLNARQGLCVVMYVRCTVISCAVILITVCVMLWWNFALNYVLGNCYALFAYLKLCSLFEHVTPQLPKICEISKSMRYYAY